MLTKTDLSQIKKIVRAEVEAEGQNIRDELQGDIKMAQIRITTEIRGVKDRLKNLEIKTTKIQKDLKTAVNFLDKEELKVTKRVKRIEAHLRLAALS
ncbi:hypothetical protein A2630_03625 [Candidatus Woesebacteria bacterium RIFCSPHIGHO2_01_FULL_44_10]|uniref:Uncharacterized protein n=1 Tax=Candidatus Woesebacteria bacterium RIFCSPLOWO2_01_FULL_44_14 TaxID=1802525 RepID=A0A1F8C3U2_9BACT|nr:MAG: hypothetical protein A2630_03625 [Candidatus Woesebacteria bacterium RIFCSPHIGHO2_01_FULL_44_10]OGM54914.1 MAG: hypothetical protein A3F62_04485 [Candidatus Woesebacteria bacterium RIFCSPHIGHO2_12_FULL_44_11]OGM70325.1 MAG: hypothetical protein A2975_04630 [Candidatus Woesebacteria bacterium RIFCSPLOWO2_01_FULL_44_14]